MFLVYFTQRVKKAGYYLAISKKSHTFAVDDSKGQSIFRLFRIPDGNRMSAVRLL